MTPYPVSVNKEELGRANAMWRAFTRFSKYGLIGIIALLSLMAIFLL